MQTGDRTHGNNHGRWEHKKNMQQCHVNVLYRIQNRLGCGKLKKNVLCGTVCSVFQRQRPVRGCCAPSRRRWVSSAYRHFGLSESVHIILHTARFIGKSLLNYKWHVCVCVLMMMMIPDIDSLDAHLNKTPLIVVIKV